MQGEGQVAGFVPGDFGGSLVPDDHGAAAPPLPLVHPLEFADGQLVILNGDGEAAHRGIERGALGDGP